MVVLHITRILTHMEQLNLQHFSVHSYWVELTYKHKKLNIKREEKLRKTKLLLLPL